MQVQRAKLGVISLALLITGAIDSIRNMPLTALFGTDLIFFAILGAIFFLIPVGLVAAEWVTTKDLPAGVFNWVRAGLGPKAGFLAIWLQWINTLVWYPTVLSFIAGTMAYWVNPSWAQHPGYLVVVILLVFWSLTWLSLKGIRLAARVASLCAVLGMILPLALILVLGIIWWAQGQPMAIHVSTHALVPHFDHAESWVSLTAIITAFLGMELAAVHANDVRNVRRSFPVALLFAVVFIVLTMIMGSLVIACVIPAHQIHMVDGAMQAFQQLLVAFHLQACLPLMALLLVVGSIGGMINWVVSPAKGLMQAAEDGFLPVWFTKRNKVGVPSHIMVLQAVVVSLLCAAFKLMPSVNASYYLLTDLSTQLYVVMYVVLFIAAIVYKVRYPRRADGFRIWGGVAGLTLVSIVGLIGCAVTLWVGFMPPATIAVGGAEQYRLIFGTGLAIMIAPVFLFYRWRQQRSQS